MNSSHTKILNYFFALMALAGIATAVSADDKVDAQQTVDAATKTIQSFTADPNMDWFRNHMKEAKAVMIVPQLVKAGFILGGSGGTGVLVAHDAKHGSWTDPAFYTMGSVTFGLQIGGESAEVVMLVMSQKGIDAFLSNKFQVGADASIAAGPVGTGAQAATADIIQFSRSKGVFGGLTLEGALVDVRDSLNAAYYGKEVRPTDILITRSVHNKQADPLIASVGKAAGGS